MVKRQITTSTDEPEQRKFELPSGDMEHLFQISDLWVDKGDDNLIIVKCEVADGDELGRSLLHRVNLDTEWKGFFLTKLFLKAIKEQYKGEIEVDEDNWIGKQFHATVIHNKADNGKIYANIDKYNFDKVIEVAAKQEQKVEWPD
jgi:hypothetical protein